VDLQGPTTRRQVTILFADVAGSTALGEAHDAEAVREVMGRYFALARAAIERHGGTVEKFIGDAVMAVFGLPLAHEDDALRAVRAAAEMLDGLRRLDGAAALSVRVGVNTGDVVAGDPAVGETLVTGDTVNTAARLEQAAPPGGILVGPITVRLVADRVRFGPPVELALKGKAKPVTARPLHDLVAATPAVGGTTRERLVGRDGDLAELDRCWRRAEVARSATLASVVGDAGTGKSRLLEAFLERLDPAVPRLVGRCLSYGDGGGLWPIRELLFGHAGVEQTDEVEAVRAKVRAVFGEAPDGDRRTEDLCAGLGISDGRTTHDDLAVAVHAFLVRAAGNGGLVVALEDIHWADAGLIDLMTMLLAARWSSPMLFLATMRPAASQVEPMIDGAHVTWLRLEGLAPEAIVELLDGLDGALALPATVRARLLELSDGNPLYLTAYVSLLRELGALHLEDGRWRYEPSDTLAMPPEIRALLDARIDRLDHHARTVGGAASVFGQTFRAQLVRAIDEAVPEDVDGPIARMAEREFVEPDPEAAHTDAVGVAIGPAEAWRFRHALIRDAFYERLAKRSRARLHLAVATRLEGQAGDRITELDEVLGYHLATAVGFARELGDVADPIIASRAADRLIPAARRARHAGRLDACVRLSRQALTALGADGDPRRRAAAGWELGWGLIDQGDVDAALLVDRTALDDAERSGDTATIARAWTGIASFHVHQAQGEAALAAAERADALAEEAGDAPLLSVARHQRSIALAFCGRIGEAREMMASARALAESSRDLEALALVWLDDAVDIDLAGSTRDALARRQRDLLQLEAHGLLNAPEGLAAVSNIADLLLRSGRWAEALELMDAAERRRIGAPRQELCVTRAQVAARRGDAAEARRALEGCPRSFSGQTDAAIELIDAEILEVEGRAAEAIDAARRAEASAPSSDNPIGVIQRAEALRRQSVAAVMIGESSSVADALLRRLEQLERASGAFDVPIPAAAASIAASRIWLATPGSLDASACRTAAEAFRSLDYAYDEAETLIGGARLVRDTRIEARTLLDEAEVIAARLGTDRLAALIRRVMDR